MTDRQQESTALDEERLRQHAAVGLTSFLGHLLVAIVVVMVDRAVSGSWRTVPWVAWIVPLCLYRFSLARAIRQKSRQHSTPVLLRRVRSSVATLGLVWGVTAARFLPADDLAMQLFWLFTIAGVSSGATIVTAFDMRAGLPLVGLATVPTLVKLLSTQAPLAVPMAFLSTVYVTYTAFNSYRAYTRVVESATLRHAASLHAARLLESNAELEQQAARALRESEERFRAVFQQSPLAMALVDLISFELKEVNDVALRTFGYTRDEALGRTTSALNIWADPGADHVMLGMLHAGPISAYEIQLTRRSGERFWALINANLITVGGAPFVLATAQDVTERRQLAASALQAQKMEVVGHLAGGIAHDFNNLLTVITSTAELAMRDAAPATPLYDSLSTIRDASARAATLTAKLLAFSRKQILQPEVLDVNELLCDLTPMIRRLVGARVTFGTKLAEQPATVKADRGSIEQVLLNLAINSRDAMPLGGELHIDVARERWHRPPDSLVLAPGDYVSLAIRDTGIGMDAETMSRIFEPFFTTKETGKGTGLGLSTAHGIIGQSGGAITVDSAVGVGSTFRIFLPWVDHAPAPASAEHAHAVNGSEAILVVDDNPDIRETLHQALSASGYTVLVAPDGYQALDLLTTTNTTVDLLLTDVIMPGLSGQQLADRVRQIRSSVRILYSSGYADDAIARHGELPDGVHFIAKPYSLKALTQKVREVLDATP